MKLISTKLLIFVIILVFCSNSFAQNIAETFVYGDALPDAPELAPRGEYKIGVRTLGFVNKNQVDVLKSKGDIDPTYDRPLKVEVWYPANVAANINDLVIYDQVMGSSSDYNVPQNLDRQDN